METMLAIVCSTNEGVKALEKYDPEGTINCNGGLHGIGSRTERRIKGRFVVICLEDLRQVIFMSVCVGVLAIACEFFTQLIDVVRYIQTLFRTNSCGPCAWY